MKAKMYSTLLIAFLIFTGIHVKAQTSGISVMPQVGLNLTKLTDDPNLQTSKFRPGVEGGIWIQSKKTVFIMPGVFFAQQGLNEVYLEDVQANYDTVLTNIDYRAVKVPIMFGIQALGARIYTGPNFTYILNTDNPSFTSDSFRDLSLGLCVGAGLNIALFSFDVRYEYGISNTFIDRNTASNTLTISAGLKF